MDGAIEEHEQHRQCTENDSGPRSPRLHEGSSSHLIAGQRVKLIVQARKSLTITCDTVRCVRYPADRAVPPRTSPPPPSTKIRLMVEVVVNGALRLPQ